MRKEGEGLIIEHAPPKSLLALLATLGPLDEDFPPSPTRLPIPSSLMLYLLDTNVVSDLLRTRLEQAGRPIGGNDLLIAAHGTRLYDRHGQ